MANRIVLDACVLFPPLVRGLLMSAAEAGLFAPIWSQRILDEWRIAAVRKQGINGEGEILAIQQRMTSTFMESLILASEEDAGIALPDPADIHVVAVAITGNAAQILTFNLRDFPRRALSPYGLEAIHPDSFLWQLLSKAPYQMIPAVQQVLNAHNIIPGRQRAALKRARLSRFAKAWETVTTTEP